MTDPQRIRRAKSILRYYYDFLRNILVRRKEEQCMNNKKERLPHHITRLIIVFILCIAGVVFVYSAIPNSFTDRDLHKTLTVERESAKDISFARESVCAECHEDEYALVNSSYHRNVSCQVCHGPAQAHTQDEAITPSAPRERKLCPVCHLYDSSRPTGFPQINPNTHNPVAPCFNCHDPHDPTPTETPLECTACHAEIASTKSLSHHVQLSCEECHDVPEQHKVHPRSIRPTVPREREFCGKCHAEGAGEAGATSVNMTTHGEKYLCWQCHFPHMPEAN